MGTQTAIAWADHSWSPVKGCQHATLVDGTSHPGCTNCYAETMSKRNPATLGTWGPEGTRVITAPSGWDKIRKLHDRVPVGERQTVFPSICDPFEDWRGFILNGDGMAIHQCTSCVEPSGEYFRDSIKPYDKTQRYFEHACGEHLQPFTMNDVRHEFFALIDATPRFTWLILTKRPQNVRKMWVSRIELQTDLEHIEYRPNVFVGTSISDQATADELIPLLLECRGLCAGLFVSAEPLLSEITLRGPGCQACFGQGGFYCGDWYPCRFCFDVAWLIIGGESGHNHREMPYDAAVLLASQAKTAGVACFVKQDSGRLPGQQGRLSEVLWAMKEFPECIR